MADTEPTAIFAQHPADRCDAAGEAALIRMIREHLGEATLPSPQGIGDDCAVWPSPPAGEQLLFTTDAIVYGRHFDASCTAAQAAAKLLKRNLSDIAAMGGTPHSALLALTLAPGQSFDWLRQFIDGLRDCALHYATPVTGGDITAGAENFFAAHVTLIGHAPRPLLRSGARVGDHLFVTGALGGSIHGHHLHFTPRLEEGRWLAAQPDVRAMIDITDGLAKDLPELLPPATHSQGEHTGAAQPTAIALLDIAAIPVSAAAQTAARRHTVQAAPRHNAAQASASASHSGETTSSHSGDTTATGTPRSPATGVEDAALAHALGDGEDYELLFAVDGTTDPAAFIRRWQTHSGGSDHRSSGETSPASLHPIGRIGSVKGHPAQASLLYNAATGKPLTLRGGGFEHLKAANSD